jgi:hypothetical protein
LEHIIVVSEGEEPRESLEEVQTLRASMERRKVQWTDTCGKDLFEIREFETRYGPKVQFSLYITVPPRICIVFMFINVGMVHCQLSYI